MHRGLKFYQTEVDPWETPTFWDHMTNTGLVLPEPFRLDQLLVRDAFVAISVFFEAEKSNVQNQKQKFMDACISTTKHWLYYIFHIASQIGSICNQFSIGSFIILKSKKSISSKLSH